LKLISRDIIIFMQIEEEEVQKEEDIQTTFLNHYVEQLKDVIISFQNSIGVFDKKPIKKLLKDLHKMNSKIHFSQNTQKITEV